MKILPLDRGIEEIQWQSDADLEMLLTTLLTTSLVPADTSIDNLIDAILFCPSFTERIASTLAPHLTHRHILQPAVFQSLGKSIGDRLKEIAQHAQTPQEKRALITAADVLEELCHNTDILNAYRNLLLKG